MNFKEDVKSTQPRLTWTVLGYALVLPWSLGPSGLFGNLVQFKAPVEDEKIRGNHAMQLPEKIQIKTGSKK